MATKLKQIFDLCDWSRKVLGELPENPDERRYAWTEEDAEFAKPFITTGVIKEETPAVVRSLYLGKDDEGIERLCVREVTQEDWNPGEIGRDFAKLMQAPDLMGSEGSEKEQEK